VIALQRNDPTAFAVFTKRFIESAANAPEDTFPSLARAALRKSLKRQFANLSADALIAITEVYLAYMHALQSLNPESCVGLSDESKGANLRVNLAERLPVLFAREMAILERVASINPAATIAAPTANRAQQYINAVYNQLRKLPVQRELLNRNSLTQSQFEPYCALVIAFYEEVLALPPDDRNNLLRYLYASAVDVPVAPPPGSARPNPPSQELPSNKPPGLKPWPPHADESLPNNPPEPPAQTKVRLSAALDVNLRTGPDPNSDKVLGPEPNDFIPKDGIVELRSRDPGTDCRRHDVSSAVHTIWCPVFYGDRAGWVNAFYLITGNGRLSCSIDPTSFNCGGPDSGAAYPPRR